MRTKKRTLSLILVLALMATLLSGCAKGPDLKGVWVTEVDFGPMLVREIDKGMQESDLGVPLDSFGDYLDSLPCQIRMELKADGTYLQNVDEAAQAAMKAKLLESMVDFYYDLFRNTLVTTLQGYGIDVDTSSAEGLESVLGMKLEDYIKSVMGSDMESYTASILDELWSDIGDSLRQEGKYKVEKGKLFLSDSTEHNVDPKVYHPFTFENGVLTLERVVGGEPDANLDELYPLVFRAG